MPTLQELKDSYDTGGHYNWDEAGDEWSAEWGGTDMEWYGTLLPRIHAFLPADTILEIGCGFGRWTAYLKDVCKQLTAIDVSQKCVDACNARFAKSKHVSCYANNGTSLEIVPDRSIDFVFSFDSLVHAEEDVMRSYLCEIARKLKPNAIAFIHHSNLAEYMRYFELIKRIPRGTRHLKTLGIIEKTDGWRAGSMSAVKFRKFSEEHSLHCITQELINWVLTKRPIDCISVVTPVGSRFSREFTLHRNVSFRSEIAYIAQLSKLYSEGLTDRP